VPETVHRPEMTIMASTIVNRYPAWPAPSVRPSLVTKRDT
jgi:hypothetical protein